MQKKGLLEERKNQEKKISGRGAALANLREKIANLTDEIAHYSAQKVKVRPLCSMRKSVHG